MPKKELPTALKTLLKLVEQSASTTPVDLSRYRTWQKPATTTELKSTLQQVITQPLPRMSGQLLFLSNHLPNRATLQKKLLAMEPVLGNAASFRYSFNQTVERSTGELRSFLEKRKTVVDQRFQALQENLELLSTTILYLGKAPRPAPAAPPPSEWRDKILPKVKKQLDKIVDLLDSRNRYYELLSVERLPFGYGEWSRLGEHICAHQGSAMFKQLDLLFDTATPETHPPLRNAPKQLKKIRKTLKSMLQFDNLLASGMESDEDFLLLEVLHGELQRMFDAFGQHFRGIQTDILLERWPGTAELKFSLNMEKYINDPLYTPHSIYAAELDSFSPEPRSDNTTDLLLAFGLGWLIGRD